MSSTPSADGGDSLNDKQEQDIERGLNGHEIRLTVEQESKEEARPQQESEVPDSDVVDWDGPDDPANPKNW